MMTLAVKDINFNMPSGSGDAECGNVKHFRTVEPLLFTTTSHGKEGKTWVFECL